ncbi:membrane protein insertase YidC [Labrys monachus]|uniref:Membrane protein insertase YidC n=1 Tax=Labrys monachus TaxID=217067 RepID=A0ABU0FE57_9HYPH|nr:membrane protein insertase YidC [Labrys monachus]MDQ0392403.1 YidC/Oxa1 family membrane protein insertase [Labrys monachus]
MKKEDTKNVMLAIILTLVVVAAWQYFIGAPMQHRQQLEAQQHAAEQQVAQQPKPAPAAEGGTNAALQGGAGAPRQFASRAEAVAGGSRIRIDSPRLVGSISLTGARIDDLALKGYQETLAPDSPNVVLFSPLGTPIRPANHHDIVENEGPYFASFGWKAQAGSAVKVPGDDTQWTAKSSDALTPDKPLELDWDNGQGLVFHRTISIDAPVTQDKTPTGGYMFTVRQSVENKTSAPLQLTPYAFIRRMGTPTVAGYSVLHEGLIGNFGGSIVETTYKKLTDDKSQTWDGTKGWLGFTDKYWASALIPDQASTFDGHFVTGTVDGVETYEADSESPAVTVAPGATASASIGLFSGAKEVATLSHYEDDLKIEKISNLIDWGYLFFITKPLFRLIDFLYHLLGNFGLAILSVTVILKLCFFPLANRSYESMSKMKKVQPEVTALRERFADDKMKQQQAMMALYKENKINPLSGCLPMLLQVPVFFALYKVLFVTIEMRHQPFFGWIHDLSAPDPTTIFNLFGLIPWTPPVFLMLGVWPILMGITMFVQMQLNPAPPDPVQAQLFRFMPLVFTYMLSAFPAGLVIYYAWNNSLSILQQTFIMKKNGVKIELWDNLKGMFSRKAASTSS